MILDDIIEALDKVDVNKLGKFVFSQTNIQKWIIETILKRLENLGEAADGTDLKTDRASGGNPYSNVTMDIKSFLGQRIANVTLKDSGDFYKSFKIFLKDSSVSIDADFSKGSNHIGDNFESQFSNLKEFEDAIAGLSNEEIDFMLNNIIPREVINYLNQVLPNVA